MGIFRRAFRGLRRLFRRKKRPAATRKRRGTKKRGVRQTGQLTIKKTLIGNRQTILSNVTSYWSESFELPDIPQYLNYAALYEEFRIDKVVVKLISMNNQAPNFVNTGTVTTGLIHTVVDTNDSNIPISIQQMANDPSYRVTRATKVSHTRVIYPKYLQEVQSNSTSKPSRGWMTCQNAAGVINAVSHYGLKGCYEGGVNSAGNYTSFYLEPQFTYYISFRNPQ